MLEAQQILLNVKKKKGSNEILILNCFTARHNFCTIQMYLIILVLC